MSDGSAAPIAAQTRVHTPAWLHGLIDYAGVFPPAELDLGTAIAEYRRVRRGPHGWIVGPMIVRASQAVTLAASPTTPLTGVGPIALVADTPIAEVDAGIDVCQVEVRAVSATLAADTADALARTDVVYVESAHPEDPVLLDWIAEMRRAGHDVRAKIRTGGVSAAAFPSVEAVASFVDHCVRRAVPFKATAGLHHPFRCPSAVKDATEHGFLNLVAAVRAALAGSAAVTDVLASTDPSEFSPTEATWRNVGSEVTDGAVRRVLRSIGSCSVNEPVGYLVDLGVLANPHLQLTT